MNVLHMLSMRYTNLANTESADECWNAFYGMLAGWPGRCEYAVEYNNMQTLANTVYIIEQL